MRIAWDLGYAGQKSYSAGARLDLVIGRHNANLRLIIVFRLYCCIG